MSTDHVKRLAVEVVALEVGIMALRPGDLVLVRVPAEEHSEEDMATIKARFLEAFHLTGHPDAQVLVLAEGVDVGLVRRDRNLQEQA